VYTAGDRVGFAKASSNFLLSWLDLSILVSDYMKFLLFLFPVLGYTIFCDKRISARHKAAGGFVFRDHVLRQACWAPPILKFNKATVSTEPQISHGMPSIPLAALDGGVAASL
jgi:hypothetical protein